MSQSQWQRVSLINPDTEGNLGDDIFESRLLVRECGFSAGVIATRSTYIIGDGLKPIPQTLNNPRLNIRLKDEWVSFSKSKMRSVSGAQNLNQIVEVMCRERDITGLCIALINADQRVQVIASELLCNPSYSIDTPTMKGGMELDERGAVIAFHFIDRFTQKWTRVAKFTASGRQQVLTSFRGNHAESLRGRPLLGPAIKVLHDLKKYRKSVINASILSSEMAFFLKSDTPDDDFSLGDETPVQENGEIKVRDTKVIHLPQNTEIQMSSPSHPQTTFDGFVNSCLSEVSSAVEIDLSLLRKVYDQSYSASTAGTQDFFRSIERERNAIIDDLLTPIYNSFIEKLWMTSTVPMPGYLSNTTNYRNVRWVARGRSSINPRNDLASVKTMIEMGLKSRQQAITEINDGHTFDEINAEIEYENSKIKTPVEDVK